MKYANLNKPDLVFFDKPKSTYLHHVFYVLFDSNVIEKIPEKPGNYVDLAFEMALASASWDTFSIAVWAALREGKTTCANNEPYQNWLSAAYVPIT